MNLPSKIYYLKKFVQIVLPLSLLSLLFLIPQSYSSLHYSYNQLLSKFSSKNTVERNCIFLVFNGILALIIRASGLTAEPVGPSKGVSIPPVQDQRPRFGEEDKARIEKKIEDVEVAIEFNREEEEEVDEGENEVDDDTCDMDVEEENEVYKEEEEEEAGLDELHKKCENFIKKVRQEINGL